jgi:DNA-binding LacI/PurR family transcriptional regulator
VALVCDPSFFRAPGASPFWNLLVDQARRRGAEGGEVISLHFAVDSLDRPEAASGAELLNDGLADEIASGRVDGVLGVGLPQAVADWMERRQHPPLVSFAGPGRCIVGIQGGEYARLGVAALAAKGARRIAFIAPVAPFRLFGPVVSGESPDLPVFRAALSAHGLPFDPALVRTNRHLEVANSYHTVSHQEQGFRAAQELFGAGSDPALWPDGIVSTDDMLTSGLLTGLGKLGVVIGRDVQIASHANAGSPALLGWEEELTLMEVDPAEIVSLMFSLLETCMDGEEPENPHPAVLPRPRDQ